MPDRVIGFADGVFGRYEQDLSREVGDFVLRRADGMFAYQLAVMVDDHASGVNQVVRGADLLGSTPRQIFLLECLGLPVPAYLHLPLAVNADGSKISKRCGNGVSNAGGEMVWQALRWLGQPVPEEMRGAPPAELLTWGAGNFVAGRIPAVMEIAVDSAVKSR